MVEMIGPPRSSMLLRSSTVRRKSDTATAFAWELTAAGVQAGGLAIVAPGSRRPWTTGSAKPKS